MKNQAPLLSICIPTFNRRGMLLGLLKNIESQGEWPIEVVIHDDGSTDGTAQEVAQFAKKSPYKIKYSFDSNRGRAHALREALLGAEGIYCTIMDDDDIYSEYAFRRIFSKMALLDAEDGSIRSLCGFAFNVRSPEGLIVGTSFPSDGFRGNFIKIRADEGVEGDKKEVIKTSIVKEEIYSPILHERRVPTSLLWAKIGRKYDCLFFNDDVVIKSYLPEGMTNKIVSLRKKSPFSMARLSYLHLSATCYRSLRYRARSLLKFLYYSLLGIRLLFREILAK